MAKTVILFLALLLTAGASYFSFTNLGRMKAERMKIHELEGEIDFTNSEIADRRADIDTRQEELNDARKKNGQFIADRNALRGDIESLKREIPGLDQEIVGQQETIAKYEAVIAELKSFFQEMNVNDLEELKDKIQQLKEDRIAREKELAETEALVEAAKAVITKTEGSLAEARTRQADRSTGIRRNTQEPVIMAVNNDWGFVVINAGSAQGFSADQPLAVKRGDDFVANLAITSLQRTQMVADVVADSVPDGQRVRPGDRVILVTPRE